MNPDVSAPSAADAPDVAAFPFEFERRGDTTVAVAHGPDVYAASARPRRPVAMSPTGYAPLVGRYVNHNPEDEPVRIFVREGALYATTGLYPAQRLVHVAGRTFRPAEPAFNPERYVFDGDAGGRALRLTVSGMPMYRIDER